MIFENGKEIPLWSSVPPLSLGNNPDTDIPTITPYFPLLWKACRKVLVIFPGGAYHGLAKHEGPEFAQFFSAHGYCCFVVKYRLGAGNYHHPAELADAARAVRLVRFAAKELGIRSDAIGVIGSSAGGHLAATLCNLYSEAITTPDEGEVADISSRPDWQILCYPVITSNPAFTHKGSYEMLTGCSDLSEVPQKLSLEKSVRENTPPAFIWSTFGDHAVPCENSMLYAAALRKKNIPFELHIYEKGEHGMGLFKGHQWTEECLRWMNTF